MTRHCSACKYETDAPYDRNCPICFSPLLGPREMQGEGDLYARALRWQKPIIIVTMIVMLIALSWQAFQFIPKP